MTAIIIDICKGKMKVVLKCAQAGIVITIYHEYRLYCILDAKSRHIYQNNYIEVTITQENRKKKK